MKKYLTPVLAASIMLVSGLTFTSCSNDDKSEPKECQTFLLPALPMAEGMIPSSQTFVPPTPGSGEYQNDNSIVDYINEGVKGVTINRSFTTRQGLTYNEFMLLNPMSTILYPGCVLVGNSISNGKYKQLMEYSTGIIKWSTPDFLKNNNEQFVRQVDNPSLSDYNMLLQDWRQLREGQAEYPDFAASTTYEMNEVQKEHEFNTHLGVGVDVAEITGSIDLKNTLEKYKTNILVKFMQKAYTISMDQPRDGIFKEANVARMEGVMPVYVSDITYGRVAYCLVSSNHDYHELASALSITVPVEGAHGHGDLDGVYKKILDESEMKVCMIGGTSAEHSKFITLGYEGLLEILATQATPDKVQPIAMTLRYCNDNGVARSLMTGEYTVNNTYFVPETDHVSFEIRPSSIKARAGVKEHVNLAGRVTMTSELDNQEVVLFDKPISEYIQVESGKETPLTSFGTIPLDIQRPDGMSMRDFLKSKVTFKVHFLNSHPRGKYIDDDLGEKEYTLTVRDLIFKSLNTKMTMSSRRPKLVDVNATMTFELNPDIDGFEKI